MRVLPINRQTAEAVVTVKHYSKRLGIFWEGFGLYSDEGLLIGVCCFGQPSAPIQKHAFSHRDFRLYELTRLVVNDNLANAASFLISHSLKMLKEKPCAVISYADSAHGHCGIVYQASNWVYTGATIAHDKLYLVDGIATHPMTLRDKFGVTDPVKWAREKNIQTVKPEPKHRYFFFCGTRLEIRRMRAALNYPILHKYPKSAKSLYPSKETCVDAAALAGAVGFFAT